MDHLILDIYIYIYFFFLPTVPQKQDVTQSQFFKQNLTGLNSVFSSWTVEVKKPSLPYYLTIVVGGNIWIPIFPKSISAMGNANILIQDLNLGHWIHFLWQYPFHHKYLLFIHIFYIHGEFNKFPDFFVQAFKIVVDSWKFTMLLLYIL